MEDYISLLRTLSKLPLTVGAKKSLSTILY